MAEVILPIILVITVAKTLLVVDAVVWPGGGPVAHAAQSIRSQKSQATARSGVGSPRQRPKGAASASAPKVSLGMGLLFVSYACVSWLARSLHLRLLSMHVTCIIGQSGAAAKYLIPVSDTSCVVTHRISVSLSMLYDASLVLFLLAKAHVTNANRTLAWWEKGIIWWSRLWGWVFLPFQAIVSASAFPGSVSPEGEFCFNGFSDTFEGTGTNQNAQGFGIHIATMVVQYLLLLLLFVKPMLVRVEGTQSGGAVYRRVVLRNIFCTIAVVTSYTIMAVVVVHALLRETAESNKSAQIRDMAIEVNGLATLCITETTLPLGFSSCMKACAAGVFGGNPPKTEAGGTTVKTGTAAVRTTHDTKIVVPLEELTPSAP